MSRSKTQSSGKIRLLVEASPGGLLAAVAYPPRRGSLLLERATDLIIAELLPPTKASANGAAMFANNTTELYLFMRISATLPRSMLIGRDQDCLLSYYSKTARQHSMHR